MEDKEKDHSDEGSDWEDEDDLSENQKKRLRKKKANKRKKEEQKRLNQECNELANDKSKKFISKELDNTRFQGINSWKIDKNNTWKQTDVQEIPVSVMQPHAKNYPFGERITYKDDHKWRMDNREKIDAEKKLNDMIFACRRSGEIIKQLRHYAEKRFNVGLRYSEQQYDINHTLDNLLINQTIKACLAMPITMNINHICRNNIISETCESVIDETDIVGLEFAIESDGQPVYTSFSLTLNENCKKLIKCAQEATEAGLNACFPDAKIEDIQNIMSKIIKGYETETENDEMHIKLIKNIPCYSMARDKLQGTKKILFDSLKKYESKMEEGDLWTIGCQVSMNGKGSASEQGDSQIYVRDLEAEKVPIRMKSTSKLLNVIDKNFSGFAFTRKMLDLIGEEKHLLGLKQLQDLKLIQIAETTTESKEAKVASFYHTILIKPSSGKEIFTRGDDY